MAYTHESFKTADIDNWYASLVDYILHEGYEKYSRAGNTLSCHNASVAFDLAKGLPLLSLKKTNWEWAIKEMLWFISGSTNVKDLGLPIWDGWAAESGDVGCIYGSQWRNWPTHDGGHIDQLTNLLKGLVQYPNSRRHILEAWNVAFLPNERMSPQDNVDNGLMSLAPCHKSIQFLIRNTLPKHVHVPPNEPTSCTLDAHLYLRSSDVMLGLPFNLVQYAFLVQAVAQHLRHEVGVLRVSFGDVHIYENQFDAAREIIDRRVSQVEADEEFTIPRMAITANKPLLDLTASDVTVSNYNPLPFISIPVSI